MSETNGRCPHCEAQALAETEEAFVLRCGACGRSSLRHEALGEEAPPSPEAGTGDSPLARVRRTTRRAPGETASWPAALAAIGFTAVFYAALSRMPEGRLGELFLERGWVPYIITGVSAWALMLLGARILRLREEAAVLERDLIATNARGTVGADDVDEVLATLRARSDAHPSSFLVSRLDRALRHFQSRRRVVEVVEFLSGESAADEGRVDASYALVRVFVWAVPTLGFIGTVLGIGAAVGGFSETLEAASSLEGMKESIGSVTGGLGVAFDTTLLALVMSILIMFPASAVQRFEENLLAEIDDYCAEVLVRRLRDTAGDEVDALQIDVLATRLASLLRESDPGESGR